MTPFNALFDEFKGVFGKAYVLAGFVPAAVLVGSLILYFNWTSPAEIAAVIAEELGQDVCAAEAQSAELLSERSNPTTEGDCHVFRHEESSRGQPLSAFEL